MYDICTETPSDEAEVEALYDLCFAPGRTALSSYRLREGVPRVRDLCLLLRGGGVLLAAIRFWPVRVGGVPALLLGPIAVHPTAQGEGLGALLMRESLSRAQAQGWPRVLLVGDAPYYARFGFARLNGVDMPPPTNPDRVLGLELSPDAWVGVSGPVTRETSPDVLAGLSEIATLPPAPCAPMTPKATDDPANGSAPDQ
ncbi:GNAT family N-acetyltransferase [Paracoccus sp. (in: a-proteobacteria)]|uniref:GNAT family N-acetyltransferase n=1 Tax=Paracoccus sp. TaxID=267 RepID=UPI0026E0BFD5|nr:N-acetyltransferase [Paracoccus sp. (in: a-proteobacteria)]MDO5647918.1 N-acetyltransferase [Paracoccus sp. (in: a-proteobacteria)]